MILSLGIGKYIRCGLLNYDYDIHISVLYGRRPHGIWPSLLRHGTVSLVTIRDTSWICLNMGTVYMQYCPIKDRLEAIWNIYIYSDMEHGHF